MDKRAIGKARAESLDNILSTLLGQSDDVLRNAIKSGLLKADGTLHLGKLAELVGHKCEAATFRQNNALKESVIKANASILARKIVDDLSQTPVAKSKATIGAENQVLFLSWLTKVGSAELPAPVSHTGRLYRKAIWATYSSQALLDITSVPTWFNSRTAVKEALDQLDLKVIQRTVVTNHMESESIADDMEDSMTSALIRKLRSEIKGLKEQLAAERQAREKAELEAKQNEWQASLIATGKMPHKQ